MGNRRGIFSEPSSLSRSLRLNLRLRLFSPRTRRADIAPSPPAAINRRSTFRRNHKFHIPRYSPLVHISHSRPHRIHTSPLARPISLAHHAESPIFHVLASPPRWPESSSSSSRPSCPTPASPSRRRTQTGSRRRYTGRRCLYRRLRWRRSVTRSGSDVRMGMGLWESEVEGEDAKLIRSIPTSRGSAPSGL